MGARVNDLKSKYLNRGVPRRPESVDEQSWELFSRYVHDHEPVRDIARKLGLPPSEVNQLLSRVDEAVARERYEKKNLTPDSAVEELGLSVRTRNALRILGCVSVRDVLETNFAKSIRRFGPVSIREISTALSAHGFTPQFSQPDLDTDRIAEVVSALQELRESIEMHQRRWYERLDRMEDRLRRLIDDV